MINKLFYILTLFVGLYSSHAFAQNSEASITLGRLSFDTNKINVSPKYPGCSSDDCTKEKLHEWIKDNLYYPQTAIEHQIEGLLIVEITIDQNGQLTAHCKRDLGAYTCTNTVESLNQMELTWKPAMDHSGQTVEYSFDLPLKFRLN